MKFAKNNGLPYNKIMTVDKIKFNKNIAVLTCGNSEYELCDECVIKSGLHEGDEISLSDLDKLKEESDFILCKNYLLNQIAHYLKTERGYKNKLYDKGFRSKAINEALEYAKDKGYINDLGFAERYYEKNKRSKGILRIKNELIYLGVEKENLEFLKEETVDIFVPCEIARKFIKNKEKNADTRLKLMRHLSGKGFSYDEVISAINTVFDESD